MDNSVKIRIGRTKVDTQPGLKFGRDLTQLADITNQQLLLEIDGDIDVPIADQDIILIRGGEEFVIGDNCPPIDDNPCLRHPIKFKFNGTIISDNQVFKHAKVTVAEIKSLDQNLKQGDILVADLAGLADEVLHDNYRIILQKKDQFITVPCGNVGYEDPITKQLSEVKSRFLNASIESDGANQYLVIPNFGMPNHFKPNAVTFMMILPNGYPISAPDMFWVTPSVKLNGVREPEGASVYETYLGKTWQRFSWHYQDAQKWQVGVSDLLSHILFCQSRLALAK